MGNETLAAGGNGPCTDISAWTLFYDFERRDAQERGVSPVADDPVIKVGGADVILSHRELGGGFDSYSRTTRGQDGKWLTVQVRKWKGFFIERISIDIFNDKKEAIASVKNPRSTTDCRNGNLIISPQEAADGKYTLIKSALFAVTGVNYGIKTIDQL